MGKFIPDVDIDFQNRDKALEGLLYIPASRVEGLELKKHNVGVYFHSIPQDPITGFSSIPYEEAESRGYFKLDFLNLNIYKGIKDEAHLDELVSREPIWDMLLDQSIVDETPLFHLGGHYDIVSAYAPKSIEELAMVLAMIRPRKRHLIGKDWSEIKKEIWTTGDDELYGFKKAHSFSYAMVVIVQMNLLVEQALA